MAAADPIADHPGAQDVRPLATDATASGAARAPEIRISWPLAVLALLGAFLIIVDAIYISQGSTIVSVTGIGSTVAVTWFALSVADRLGRA